MPPNKPNLRADYGLGKPLLPRTVSLTTSRPCPRTSQTSGQPRSSLRPNEKVVDLFIEFLWPTILLVGSATILSTVFGDRDRASRVAGNEGASSTQASLYGGMVFYSMPEGWLGMMLLICSSPPRWGGSRSGGYEVRVRPDRVRAHRRRREPPLPAAADPHARLHRRVLDHHAVVTAGGDERRLHPDRTSQGCAGDWCASPRRPQRDPADVHAHLPEVRVRAGRRDHRRVRLLVAGDSDG